MSNKPTSSGSELSLLKLLSSQLRILSHHFYPILPSLTWNRWTYHIQEQIHSSHNRWNFVSALTLSLFNSFAACTHSWSLDKRARPCTYTQSASHHNHILVINHRSFLSINITLFLESIPWFTPSAPSQIPLSIYFILHTSYHQFLSLNHYHHPSIPYSFVTGLTPTCFINPSHIRLSAFLRTASMDYRTRTGSSLLIDLEL